MLYAPVFIFVHIFLFVWWVLWRWRWHGGVRIHDSNNRGDSKAAGSQKGLIIAPCKTRENWRGFGRFLGVWYDSFGWQIGFANLVSCHCFFGPGDIWVMSCAMSDNYGQPLSQNSVAPCFWTLIIGCCQFLVYYPHSKLEIWTRRAERGLNDKSLHELLLVALESRELQRN